MAAGSIQLLSYKEERVMRGIWDLIRDIWDTANYLVQIAMVAAIILFFLPIGVGLIGNRVISTIVAFLPVLLFLYLMVSRLDTATGGILAIESNGRSFLYWVSNLIAADILLGIYCILGPLKNNRWLVALLVLFALALLFLLAGTGGSTSAKARNVCLWAIAVITVLFFVSGWWRGQAQEARAKVEQLKATSDAVAKAKVDDCLSLPTPAEGERIDITERCVKIDAPSSPTGWLMKPTWARTVTIHPKGLVRISKMSGESWDDAPGRVVTKKIGDAPEDQLFRIRSLEGKNVEVTIKSYSAAPSGWPASAFK